MGDLRTEAERALADGFTFLVHLTAVDEIGRSDEIRVLVLLERPEDGERRTLSTLVPRDGGVAPRLDDLYPAAAWLQRQVHDLFGVSFEGADDRPLIHHGTGAPLRKDVLLEPRSDVSWPGALEPGESEASPSRRKLLPVGVPDPTVAQDPRATPEDIALSATGTRVRGRR